MGNINDAGMVELDGDGHERAISPDRDLAAKKAAGQVMNGMDTMEQREVELLAKIMKYIISNKVNGTISFMLNEYSEGLSKDVIDMIREEIKNSLEGKIQMLLQSAFMADEGQWFSLLGITEPNQEQ